MVAAGARSKANIAWAWLTASLGRRKVHTLPTVVDRTLRPTMRRIHRK